MIPELGHFALAMACAIALAQAVLPIWGAHRADARLMALAPALLWRNCWRSAPPRQRW